MSRNPFQPCEGFTEFSWGGGRYPAPYINFAIGSQSLNDPLASNNGSGFSIADPDVRQQMLDLAAAKRTDLGNPREASTPAFTGGYGEHPMYYAKGNTDRYGAGPPLVTERRYPRQKRWVYAWPSWMQRQG